MKKSKNYLKLASVVLATSALLMGGLTSCGPTEEPPVDSDGWVVKNEGNVDLSLPEAMVVTSDDTTFFAPYIVSDATENYDFVSNGGDALLYTGQTVQLLAYGVPEGASLSVLVTDTRGNETSVLTVNSDGSIVAPTVSEKTDFIVTLFCETESDVYKKSVNVSVIPHDLLATGDKLYGILNQEERSDITGVLEEYALENGLTGMTYEDNGGFVVYNERVHTPLLDGDNYLPGYGWGTSLYGTIDSPLSGEATEAYKMYYHSQISPSAETGEVNYLNSQLATVSDLYSYIASDYYQQFLNEDYSGAYYAPCLARSEPIALNMDESGMATKWKIPVWVGGTTTDETAGVMANLGYRTNSSQFSSYDNHLIELSDYLTPFKLLATQSIGWYRGSEQAAEETPNRQIVGFADFYNSSANNTALPSDEEFSSQVGVSLDYSDNSIIIELEGGLTQDFAIYQLDSLWSNPIDAGFVADLGGGDVIDGAEIYGTSPSGMTPVDTILSVGPYYLESYNSQQYVAFKKNENWFVKEDDLGREVYQIEGYHIRVNSAMESDSTAAFTAWENNLVDSASIIDSKWEEYENSPRRRSIIGDYNYRWTFNRMDKLTWDYYFGEEGTWSTMQDPTGENRGSNKPILANDNFFYGLNLTMDRLSMADYDKANPATDYFNGYCKVSPNATETYNYSDQHDAAVRAVYGSGFDDLEQSAAIGISYLQNGLVEEFDAGHYKLGTASNPTVISFELGTVDSARIRTLTNFTRDGWSEAVNTALRTYVNEDGKNPFMDESGNLLVKFDVDVDYVASANAMNALIVQGMWSGRIDAQGVYLITGNAYDTINALDILFSDEYGGFELNFAVRTSIPSGTIFYDGQYWSMETLWAACNGGVTIGEDGYAL